MRTLGIIPARGGSKGILRKNVRAFAGRPLIAWTIESALQARSIETVIVSTDDDEIASISRACGAEVPFMRPASISQDDTPGVATVLHAMKMLPEYDAIVLLQPTSPLRTTSDIDGCVDQAATAGAPSAASVTEPDQHPFWTYRLGDSNQLMPLFDHPIVLRRQQLPSVYALNGAVYFAQSRWLWDRRALVTDGTVGYPMPKERSVDLDTLADWAYAEHLLRNRG